MPQNPARDIRPYKVRNTFIKISWALIMARVSCIIEYV
jgi:hypothetical protein